MRVRVIEVCPDCRSEIISNMSIDDNGKHYLSKKCLKCGFEWLREVEVHELEYVAEIPFVPVCPVEWVKPTVDPVPEMCRKCSNHPSNGGYGVCHCIGPYVSGEGEKCE